jgi:hypothetical protein
MQATLIHMNAEKRYKEIVEKYPMFEIDNNFKEAILNCGKAITEVELSIDGLVEFESNDIQMSVDVFNNAEQHLSNSIREMTVCQYDFSQEVSVFVQDYTWNQLKEANIECEYIERALIQSSFLYSTTMELKSYVEDEMFGIQMILDSTHSTFREENLIKEAKTLQNSLDCSISNIKKHSALVLSLKNNILKVYETIFE